MWTAKGFLCLLVGLIVTITFSPAYATNTQIWQIGVFDGSKNEYYTGIRDYAFVCDLPEDAVGVKIWQIGTFDNSKNEFSDPPICDACPQGGGCTPGVFVIGETPVSRFPRAIRSSDLEPSKLPNGCNAVTISFTVNDEYTNVMLQYRRMGGEADAVFFDGVQIGTAGPQSEDPYPATDYLIPVGTIAVGTHTIRIVGLPRSPCTSGSSCQPDGKADGGHDIDALMLTGDILSPGTQSEFVIGVTPDDLLPSIRSSDVSTAQPFRAFSAASVTIRFTVDDEYTDAVLRYSRMGGEKDAILYDGVQIGVAGPQSEDPYPAVDYYLQIGTITPGTHTIRVVGLERSPCTGGSDCWADGKSSGLHDIDAMELMSELVPTWSSGFEEGDVYVVTNATGANVSHVIKLDPVTGDTTTLHVFPVAGSDFATYDPIRDMILTSINYNGYHLWGVRADGTRIKVGPGISTYFMPSAITARGDGKVYYLDGAGLQYLDISGSRHVVSGVDQAKMSQLENGAHMVYDPGSNALFLVAPSGANGSDFCSGLTGRTMVLKIPLNAEGTALDGTITCVERNVSPSSNDEPENIGLGPDGSIFIAVSTNTNDREPRMLTVDPFSMNALSTFAQSGPFIGAAALAAGVYSHRINKAVIASWGDRPVRTYAMGEVGSGTILTPFDVGNIATLIEVYGRCDECSTCPATLCAAVPDTFIWDRSVDWALGTDDPVNPALDQNGCPVWSYEWTQGDGLDSPSPWYLNPTTKMLWDPSWFGGGAHWGRGDDVEPNINGGAANHVLGVNNWPYIPLLRWKNCTDGIEEICLEGELVVDWSGTGGVVGSPVNVDVVIAHVVAADGSISPLLSTTVSKPSNNEEREQLAVPVSLQLTVGSGDQIMITHRARNSMASRWIFLRDDITITKCGAQIGSIAGRVVADCPEEGTGLHGVVVDLFEVGTGNLVESDTTDTAGQYVFEEIEAGDYTVSFVTPLGYSSTFEEANVTVTGGVTTTADFSLNCVDITPDAKTIGFWKHQVGVATGGKGRAQIDGETLCSYLDLIEVHFNSNAINQVVIYDPPASGECADKLEVAKDLLNLKGNVSMTARARQQLTALLLNVAGGYLSLTAMASEDSATVSQAITYCDLLLDDQDSKNDETAKTVADELNNGRLLEAGTIPSTIENIAYSSRWEPTETPRRFGLDGAYPNPFNPQTTIAYAIPEQGLVTLKVYDVRGRLVRAIVNEEQPAGEHRAVWRGRDRNGSSVASGIYFVRLEFGSNTQTRKVVLLK